MAPDLRSHQLRPTAKTPIANLFLAGDWMQTGLPATIESAVISGRAAAAAVVIARGRLTSDWLIRMATKLALVTGAMDSWDATSCAPCLLAAIGCARWRARTRI